MSKIRTLIILFSLLFLAIALAPIPDLELAYSKIVYDDKQKLLSAQIAEDEQWRFPIEKDLPISLEKAIIYFEDEYFLKHPGFNPVSILKAIYINAKAGKIVRGGSTITMQVMRMYHGNPPRSYFQKAKELLGAVKLELLYSKKDILKMWASVAPFGGNTVGASTASWRYFQRDLDQLSWAEYATLAVLPNTPSRVHMLKNVEALKVKRDQLLLKLYEHNEIDSIDWVLARDEEIRFEAKELPQESIHFMDFMTKKFPQKFIYHSTINSAYQDMLNEILNDYSKIYQVDGIQNAAATIIDIQKNELVAYVGNTNYQGEMRYVDCVQAPRSYGSLLKPFLYAYALNQGYFLPHENIKDIPTNINGFVPKNFDRNFRGIVPLDQMVSKSLNVPAVRVLNYVGLESFHHILTKNLGFSHINKDAGHHGLSLILGGAEASMWDLSRAYKGMVRNHLDIKDAYNDVKCLQEEEPRSNTFRFHPLSSWYSLKAMMSVNRPKEEQYFLKMGGQNVAWKTGTSYGHRDAWAIGANDRYLVSVWVGNEDGAGVYNLTGAKKAGPLLFKIIRNLDTGGEITEKIVWGKPVELCEQSGMLKSSLCTNTDILNIPNFSHQLRQCNKHQVLVSNSRDVHLKNDTIFYLHPFEDYYYSQFSGKHLSLPANANQRDNNKSLLNIIYPESDAVIFIPKKIEKEFSNVELKANTSKQEDVLFWFLNGEFLRKTKAPHHVQVDLDHGEYALLINDEKGNKDQVQFKVVKRFEKKS
jgi:penicillin-binding protein 1C